MLALIDPSSPELPLLMLRRNRKLPTHAGQVALPGGRHRAADGPLWQTALREAREELGVPEEAVETLGYAHPVAVPPTGFLVVPAVALMRRPFPLRMAPAEAETWFWFPLRDRRGQVELAQRPMLRLDGEVAMPGYLFQGHFVWGATGRILDDLRSRLGEPTSGPEGG